MDEYNANEWLTEAITTNYSFPILPAQRSPKTGLEMLASQPALVMYKEKNDVYLMSDHCRDIQVHLNKLECREKVIFFL